MKKILVVAPHPDDETLGCGGTLLKHKSNGDKIIWLIVTGIIEAEGFSQEKVESRNSEIEKVTHQYDFDMVYRSNFPTTKLDDFPIGKIVENISAVIKAENPEVIYIPYPGDVHSDHKMVFDTVVSCTKWFRYSSIKRILCYETLSETDFGINPDYNGFRPNVFVNIEEFIEKKIDIMKIYESELGEFPFPRSEKAIQALAMLRGAASGCKSAEAFMLLKEIW
jgi:LmbE family N-acetylglucosaminyl deacetylase